VDRALAAAGLAHAAQPHPWTHHPMTSHTAPPTRPWLQYVRSRCRRVRLCMPDPPPHPRRCFTTHSSHRPSCARVYKPPSSCGKFTRWTCTPPRSPLLSQSETGSLRWDLPADLYRSANTKPWQQPTFLCCFFLDGILRRLPAVHRAPGKRPRGSSLVGQDVPLRCPRCRLATVLRAQLCIQAAAISRPNATPLLRRLQPSGKRVRGLRTGIRPRRAGPPPRRMRGRAPQRRL
jgi:hypothetical protein